MFLQALLNAGRCGAEIKGAKSVLSQVWDVTNSLLRDLIAAATHSRNSLVKTWEPEGWMWDAPLGEGLFCFCSAPLFVC